MIKGFLAGAAVVITLLSLLLVHHLGIFAPVTFAEEIRGPYYAVFQDHNGSYYQISEVISRVEAAIKSKNLECRKTFGEYLDNPGDTDEDRLRSRGGCISDQAYPAVPDFGNKEFPKQSYLVARFSGSPAIGPWKVYSAAKRYLIDHQLTASSETVEIYTLNGEGISTEYLFPLR